MLQTALHEPLISQGKAPSDHRHSTIYVKRLASHIGSLIAGEINCGSGNLGGRTEPLQWYPRDDRLLLIVVQAVRHPSCDETGRDAVNGDVATAEFLSKGFCQAGHAGLGCRVVRLPGIAGDAYHRCDADDPAKPAFHHAAHSRASKLETGGQIDFDD